MRCLGLVLASLFSLSLLATPAHTQENEDECPNPKGWKPTDTELKEVLKAHENWFEAGGFFETAIPGKANLCRADLIRANLSGANLSGANLSGAVLNWADLSGAVLNWADLSEANLIGADLSGANLIGADLSGAKLWSANLSEAKLIRANLSGAKLIEADLSGAGLNWADLSGAKLFSANLSKANLSGADLIRANLSEANLSGADLSGADLIRADLNWADLSEAKLFSANLSKANLSGANLSEANLIGADLSGADLIEADLENAKLTGSVLKNAIYQPVSAPAKGHLSGIRDLTTVRFDPGEHSGLVMLRAALQEVGLRQLEREATFALEHGKARHARESKFLMERLGGWLQLIFFEWTTGWGLYPGRTLLIMLGLMVGMTIVYTVPIATPETVASDRHGIFRVWPQGRMERSNAGMTAATDIRVDRLSADIPAVYGWALYFSILSTFHIGWRDLNVGSWLSRIQPREYALRARGWVRVVSGVQSLISVYLLAMWALTYFGRPFE